MASKVAPLFGNQANRFPRKRGSMYELTVRCNCGHTVRLPLTKPSKRVLDQLPLATGGLPANVLCPNCNHASAYSKDRFRKAFFNTIDTDQPHADQISACMQTECGVSGCVSLVTIQMRMRVSDDLREDALRMLFETSLVGAVCEKGDLSNRPALRGGGKFRLLAFPGWESLDWNSLASDTPRQ